MKIQPKITLGTVQLGLDYGISNKDGKPGAAKAYEILDAAVEGGITSFDTASAYGDSEVILGNYFSKYQHDLKDPEIITKISIPADSKISSPKELSETVVGLIQISLDRLKAESVYGVMLHNAGNLFKYKEAVADALMYAKEEGLAKNIGVSVYTVEDIEEFLKYDFLKCIQLPVNIMNMRLIKSGVLDKLKQKSTVVYARSIFLQGLFFMEPCKLPPKLSPARPLLEKLHEISRASGLSIAEIAFGYIRDMRCIDKLVLGADNSDQVRENIKLLNAPGPDSACINEIQNFFSEVPEVVLNPNQWR